MCYGVDTRKENVIIMTKCACDQQHDGVDTRKENVIIMTKCACDQQHVLTIVLHPPLTYRIHRGVNNEANYRSTCLAY
jgi:hypothetical protein